MDDVVHHTIDQITEKFAFRARTSLVMIAVLAAIGLCMISLTADKISPALAIFIAGIALCVCAHNMIIGWGASTGHADLATLAADGHERMHHLIAERLETMEAIERQTGEAVVIAMDDLRQRRKQQNHG